MITFLLLLTALNVGSQGFAVWTLWSRRRRMASALSPAVSQAFYPAISVITSLKGPTPGAAESVRSLLTQDYPGGLELIFAAKDGTEPLLAEMRAVVAANPSQHSIKWVYPVDVAGLNPRTAKIASACEAASSPWIFATTVDTRFAPGFLRRAMDTVAVDANVFVTSFPVIDRPRDLSASLEALGLNVDVSTYFLFASIARKPCAYGGAFLFSRELLTKVGGYRPFLRLLTDDVTMAQAFASVGGECRLSPDFAYVRQERHSFREFWTRQVRWRMIARYFMPGLFWMTPLAWTHLYLALAAIVLRSSALAWALVVLTAARMAIGFAIQSLLETAQADRRKAWALPMYDWISPLATIVACCSSTVRWGTTQMALDASGAIVATQVSQQEGCIS